MEFLRYVLISTAVLFSAQVAAADSCTQSRSIEAEFAASTIVVAAEAKTVTIEFAGHPNDRSRPREVQIVQWEVLENWKGQYKPTDWFKTRTVINDTYMGRSVTQGEAYLLYLIDPMWVSSCGRTAVLKHAVRDIPVLYRLGGGESDGT
jgi:hypothetical protein